MAGGLGHFCPGLVHGTVAGDLKSEIWGLRGGRDGSRGERDRPVCFCRACNATHPCPSLREGFAGEARDQVGGFTGSFSGVAFVVEFVEAVGVEVRVLLDLDMFLHCRVQGFDGIGEAGEGDELGAVGDGGFFGRELSGDIGALEPEGEGLWRGAVAASDFGVGLVGAGEVFDEGEVLGLGFWVEKEVRLFAGRGGAVFSGVVGFDVGEGGAGGMGVCGAQRFDFFVGAVGGGGRCRMWDFGCRSRRRRG